MLTLYSVHHDTDPRWFSNKNGRVHILGLVTKGRCFYEIDGETVDVNKGEMIYIPQRANRFGSSDPEQPHEKFSVLFEAAKPGSPLSFLSGGNGFPFVNEGRYCKWKPRSFEYVRQRYALMFMEYYAARPFFFEKCTAILLELMAIASEELMTRHLNRSRFDMAKAMADYMLGHYREAVTIEQLARLIGRTPNYSIVVFREIMGVPPIQYLHQIRLQVASDLLQHTDMTIGQISEAVGFCNQAYFNRMFKKMIGTAPSRVRSR